MARHVIILGGGISGLSAGWRLSDGGATVDVFEALPSIGGLAGTLREQGYCLDIGPHSFFSHDSSVVRTVCDLFDDDMQSVPRRVKFCYRGNYLDYPLTAKGIFFQMGFWPGARAACSFLKSRISLPARRRSPDEEETVRDWAVSNFGEYLYRSFFKPYTEQFWKVPCEDLSSRSIPTHTRMSFANTLKLLLRKKSCAEDNSLIEREMYPAYYPRAGFVEIAEKIASRIEKNGGRIHRNTAVSEVIELSGGRMRVKCRREGRQEEMEGDRVISTVPLPVLSSLLRPALAQEAMSSARRLDYRSLVVLGMLTNKQRILDCGYVYLLNRPFNRIFEMNEFSSNTSGPDENILAVEIPCLRDSAVWSMTKEELFRMCIPSLAQDGFIEPGDVKRLFLVKAAHAYPVYRRDYAFHLARLMDHLGKYRSLATLGRSGEFMYMDIDQCIKRAFDFVDRYVQSGT